MKALTFSDGFPRRKMFLLLSMHLLDDRVLLLICFSLFYSETWQMKGTSEVASVVIFFYRGRLVVDHQHDVVWVRGRCTPIANDILLACSYVAARLTTKEQVFKKRPKPMRCLRVLKAA